MEEQERVQRGNSLDSHQEFSMDYREDMVGSDTISANETCKRDVDDTIRNVLRGKLDNLPHPESNTVRIFLSSTFSDFKAERNILHQIAYPELRSYCCDLGLDLEVVDMRWGLTDDVINDHQVSALCIDEIVACQNVSCGPNFVMFLGNRYGYRPFPSKIPICEFEILQRIVEEEKQESSHLLLDWFKKDENNVPPVYVLQPVHHQLPLDKASNQKIKKEMSKAKDEWNHIHDRLHELLMMAADKAYKQGRITKTAKHKYCTSVTEEEIRQGWLRSSNPNANVMCYIRNINDIEPHIEDSKDARMFIDVKVDEKTGRAMVDREAQELRESLIKTIRQNMNKENIKEYDLAWEGSLIQAHSQCGCELGQQEEEEGCPMTWLEEDVIPREEDLLDEMDEEVQEVLRGSLKHLPPIPSHTVRIFLSSTFTDFVAERNILTERAYPILRKYCSDLGLELEVVDMRWGLTDDVINDHQVSSLCIDEIVQCQKVSCGPNFVIFLGDRYGYRPFPAKIPAMEFEILLGIMQEKSKEDHDLLLQWFSKDENSIPAEYILQPICERFKYYGDLCKENAKESEADRREWDKLFSAISRILREAACIARDSNLISLEHKRKYFISVTEDEILQGLSRAEHPDMKVMCYRRNLLGLRDAPFTKDTKIYTDLRGDVLDQEAQLLREELGEAIERKLPEGNKRTYNVPWKGKAMDQCPCDDHDQYLDMLTTDFVEDMQNLIQKNKPLKTEGITSHFLEVLHHATFAKSKLKVFCGRSSEIEQIKKYLTTDNNTQDHTPLIVSGKSGYGKTALLAYVAYHIQEWVSPDAVTVLRFLGTSSNSSDISETVKSIMIQIGANYSYHYRFPEEEGHHIWDLKHKLFSMLNKISLQRKAPLVIILDAVDQLKDAQGVYNMLWLPRKLPQNIYMIVSTLSDRFNCLENIKKRMPDPEKYVHLEPLSEKSADEVINSQLEKNDRKLNHEQRKRLAHYVHTCKEPLFLKLIMDKMLKLSSYFVLPSDVGWMPTAKIAINFMFKDREIKYGKVFVSHALGYLTCGQAGLSSLEMNDVLSCDDLVLNEVYQYHDPPLEGIIRIPALMWARLKYALQEYLVHKQIDGKTVSTWYHRQFWETAEERFLGVEAQKKMLHSNLADIFLQENGIHRTIILNQRGGKVIVDADRNVTPQVLSSQNPRKLNAVPHHLYHAGRLDDLRRKCLLDFTWLFIKILGSNIINTLKEYKEWTTCLNSDQDGEIHLLHKMLSLSMMQIIVEPKSLSYLLQERLGDAKKKGLYIKKMITDGKKWLKKTSDTLLIPTHCLNLNSPESPITHDIPLGSNCLVSAKHGIMIFYWSEDTMGYSMVTTMNVINNELIEGLFTMHLDLDSIAFSEDEKAYGFSYHNGINVCDTRSGDVIKEIRSHTERDLEKMKLTSLAISTAAQRKVAIALSSDAKNISEDTERHLICIIDGVSDQIIHKVQSVDNEAIETIHFVSQDEVLVTTSKKHIRQFDMKTMKLINQLGLDGELQRNTIHLAYGFSQLVCIIKNVDVANFFIYNYDNKSQTKSDIVKISKSRDLDIFGMIAVLNDSMFLSGAYICSPKCETVVCLWEPSTTRLEHIVVAPQGCTRPASIAVKQDANYAFIGWKNGYITVIDLLRKQEVMVSDLCEQTLNDIKISVDDKELYTLSVDNSVKIWNIESILEDGISRSKKSVQEMRNNLDIVMNLSHQDNCLDITIANGSCITVPSDSHEAPSFWKLSNGEILSHLSESLSDVYKKILKIEDLALKDFKHGKITTLEDGFFIYERASETKLFLCVIQNYNDPVVRSHRVIENYKGHIVLDSVHGYNEATVITLSGHILEAYSLPFLCKENEIALPEGPKTPKHAIDLPSSTKEIHLAVTLDGKYCLIGHVSNTGDRSTMDIVDLHQNSFIRRCLVPFTIQNSPLKHISFMVWNQSKLSDPHIFSLSSYEARHKEADIETEYRCILYSRTFLSGDRTLGIELTKNKRLVTIWRLSTLEKLQVLSENYLMNVTCLDISHDNKYVAFATFHKFLTIWSVDTGECVGKYWANEVIQKVKLSPTANYVVIQVHSGLDKTRGIILRAKNLYPRKRTNKVYSREDM